MSTNQPTPDSLLEHASFLRALAGRLLADPHDADDVVQNAYLAALRGDAFLRNPRAWLAGTVKKQALLLRRGAGRRRVREQRAARPDATEDAASAVSRLEANRSVVDAVVSLEEKYRTVVVLHFFDGLTVREIATRHGVPASTVRTRLQRAIEQLRGKLDREHGSRRAWALALIPLIAPASSAAGLIATAAVLGAVLTGALVFGARHGDDPAPPRAPNAVADAGTAGPTESTGDSGNPVEDHVESSPGARTGRRLRVVSSRDATPLAHVPAIASGTFPGNEARLLTDADGYAALPATTQPYKVHVRHVGFFRATVAVDPGEDDVLVSLRPGIAVRGRVVIGPQGRAGTRVLVTEKGTGEELDATVTDENGRFDIVAVRRETPFFVLAQRDGFLPARVEAVRSDTGGELVLDLAAGVTLTGIVHGATADTQVFAVDAELPDVAAAPALVRSGPTGPEVAGRTIPDSDGEFSFAGARRGRSYLVIAQIGARRIMSAPIAIPSEGRPPHVELDARAAPQLHLRIRDDENQPVRNARVTLAAGASFVGMPMRSPDADGRLTYMPPRAGLYKLTVQARGFADLKRDVQLAAGQDLRLDLQLSRGLTLRGRIVDTHNDPVAGLTVVRYGKKPARAETDANGDFVLGGLENVAGMLDITDPQGRHGSLVIENVTPGQLDPLTIGPAPVVTGRMSRDGVSVRVLSQTPGRPFWQSVEKWVERDDTRAFGVAAVPTGRPLRLAFFAEGVLPTVIERLDGVAPGENVDLGEIRFRKGVPLAFTIVDSKGKPVPEARTELICDAAFLFHELEADEHGRITLDQVPAAPATLTVQAPGFLPAEFAIADLAAAPARFTIVRFGILRCKPAKPGTEFYVTGTSTEHAGASWFDEAEEEEDGAITFKLPPGTWKLQFSDDSQSWRDGGVVTITAGETVTTTAK